MWKKTYKLTIFLLLERISTLFHNCDSFHMVTDDCLCSFEKTCPSAQCPLIQHHRFFWFIFSNKLIFSYSRLIGHKLRKKSMLSFNLYFLQTQSSLYFISDISLQDKDDIVSLFKWSVISSSSPIGGWKSYFIVLFGLIVCLTLRVFDAHHLMASYLAEPAWNSNIPFICGRHWVYISQYLLELFLQSLLAFLYKVV